MNSGKRRVRIDGGATIEVDWLEYANTLSDKIHPTPPTRLSAAQQAQLIEILGDSPASRAFVGEDLPWIIETHRKLREKFRRRKETKQNDARVAAQLKKIVAALRRGVLRPAKTIAGLSRRAWEAWADCHSYRCKRSPWERGPYLLSDASPRKWIDPRGCIRRERPSDFRSLSAIPEEIRKSLLRSAKCALKLMKPPMGPPPDFVRRLLVANVAGAFEERFEGRWGYGQHENAKGPFYRALEVLLESLGEPTENEPAAKRKQGHSLDGLIRQWRKETKRRT